MALFPSSIVHRILAWSDKFIIGWSGFGHEIDICREHLVNTRFGKYEQLLLTGVAIFIKSEVLH